MPRLIHIDKIPSRSLLPDENTLEFWQPAEADIRILRWLWRYRRLTREMIQYLIVYEDQGLVYTSRQQILTARNRQPVRRSGPRIGDQLTKLWRYRYAKRYRRFPTPSTQDVYSSTWKGVQVSQAGSAMLSDPDRRKAVRQTVKNLQKPMANYEHTLGLILFRIMWELATVQHKAAPKTRGLWRDKERARTRNVIKNQFTVYPNASQPTQVVIHPDMTIWSDKGQTIEPLFIEFQRTPYATIQSLTRLRHYAQLVTDAQNTVTNVAKRFLKQDRVSLGTVLFITLTKAYRETLRRRAQRMFTGLDYANRFQFACFTDFFTPLDDGQKIISPQQFFSRRFVHTATDQQVSFLDK